jgi:hypothetical protein
MIFIILAAIVALSLAAVSEAFSILGLAQTFPSIYWSVIAMGSVLGAAKLVGASFAYRYWDTAPKKVTLPIVVLVVALTIVSIGSHIGYLSNGYQHDSLPMKQISVQIDQLEKERDRKIERKHEIDTQIAQLPTDRAASRVKLSKQFSDEQTIVTTRVNALDEKITELKTKEIDAMGHVGPITFIANAFGLTTDAAVKWYIFIIASVFDPLALFLTISISVMIGIRKIELTAESEENDKPVPRTRRKKVIEPSADLFEITKDDNDEKIEDLVVEGGTEYKTFAQPNLGVHASIPDTQSLTPTSEVHTVTSDAHTVTPFNINEVRVKPVAQNKSPIFNSAPSW